METLRNELLKAKFTQMNGADASDLKAGYVEALKFCIRKHEDKWDIEDFLKDLRDTIEELGKDTAYNRGIIAGLKFNLKNMEVATNE